MAQAARLNLRMQKELKLLMTDPPPGVSLPTLSDNDNLASSSLTSIEARVEGPEGTVYSKGVFTVKIQIPERYPFQPPNVTFVTPIYHPNIDNGGRICLDILNLPPKGAWQPSLNISTVLTSIGLLLSEPNPDDGLMAEASREYKYNRHVFDQKAQSWTELYASAGGSGTSTNVVNSAKQSEMEVQRVDVTLKNVEESDGRRKKLQLGEKLSLKLRPPVEENHIDDKENVVLQTTVETAEMTSRNASEMVGRRKKLQLAETLSVKSIVPAETKCSQDKENAEVLDKVEMSDVTPRNDQNEGRRKKLQLGQRLSLKPTVPVKTNCINDNDDVDEDDKGRKLKSTKVETDSIVEKENVVPNWISMSWSESPTTDSPSSPVLVHVNDCGNKSLRDNARNYKEKGGHANVIETIIVSDSEESDDEKIVVSRAKISLMRKRVQMAGKRKGMQ